MRDRPTSAGRARGSRLPARGDDSGQILVLTLGLTLVVLLLVTVIVSLTGIHLERKRLLDLADNLALAAADAMTEEVIYGAGAGAGAGAVTSPAPGGAAPGPDVTSDTGLALTDDAVAREVADYLAMHPRALDGLSDVVVVLAQSPDGRSAQVVLTSRAQPALISPVTSLFSDGVTLTAQSTARAW